MPHQTLQEFREGKKEYQHLDQINNDLSVESRVAKDMMLLEPNVLKDHLGKGVAKISPETRALLKEQVEIKIIEKGQWLVDKLFELAEGVNIVDHMKDGSVIRYYKTVPDRNALTYLLDRAFGKPVDVKQIKNTNLTMDLSKLVKRAEKTQGSTYEAKDKTPS